MSDADRIAALEKTVADLRQTSARQATAMADLLAALQKMVALELERSMELASVLAIAIADLSTATDTDINSVILVLEKHLDGRKQSHPGRSYELADQVLATLRVRAG